MTQRELSPVRASRADGDSLPGSLLWSPQNNVAFGAKDIRVEVGDPLPAVRRDVEIANGRLNVWRHAVPIELWILVDDVGGAWAHGLSASGRRFMIAIPRKRTCAVDAGTAISGPAKVESGYNVPGNATEETSCL